MLYICIESKNEPMFNIKKSLLLFCLSPVAVLVAQGNGRNFFLDQKVTRSYQLPAAVTSKALSTSSAPQAVVSVETATVVAPVLATQFGVNTTFRNGSDQRTRGSLYDGIVKALRFPAGSGSNTYFFDGNIPVDFEDYYDQTNVLKSVSAINALSGSNMTPAVFSNFKKDINGEPIVVVNYFYARYGKTAAGTRAARVQQAADYAAAFVRKMNIELGTGVKYWEVGNEIYGKWEVGYKIANASIGTVTGKEYGEDFRVFVQAMKAVDPTIKVGAVVAEDDEVWNAGVLPEVKDHADFLSVHEYFTTVNDATPANILAAVPLIGSIKSTLQNWIVKYTGKPADYYPIAMTEFNARGAYNGSMLNGVFLTQIIGEQIKHGYGLSSLWVSEWNWDGATQDVKAFLAKNDPDQDDYTPRPAYLPYYYFSKCFGDNMVQTTVNSPDIKAYASTFSSGQAGIVLINPTSTTKTVKLQIYNNGVSFPVDKLQWYEMYSNTIEPTVAGYKKFWINGQTSVTTGGGPDLSTVKPYQTGYSANSVFTLPAYSVFFVVATKSITSTGPQKLYQKSKTQAIELIQNYHFDPLDDFRSIEIFDMNGRKVLQTDSRLLYASQLPRGWFILRKTYPDRIENILLLNKNQFSNH